MRSFKPFNTFDFETFGEALSEANNIYKNVYIESTTKIKDLETKKDSDLVFKTERENKDDSGIYIRLKHIASIGKDESNTKYDSYPCNNDFNSCNSNCFSDFKADFKENNKYERMFCNYRLSKIYWINEIMKLYHNNDKRVKGYIEEKSKNVDKVFLFFQEGKSYFLICFERVKRGNKYKYFFKTSYPVVMRSLIKKTKSKIQLYKKYGKIKK